MFEILTTDTLASYPNQELVAEILEDIEEINKQFEEGIKGIRKIKSLVENVYIIISILKHFLKTLNMVQEFGLIA